MIRERTVHFIRAEVVHFIRVATLKGWYILNGTPTTFDALTRDIAEEIGFQLSPPPKLKQLANLYGRLTPDSDIF